MIEKLKGLYHAWLYTLIPSHSERTLCVVAGAFLLTTFLSIDFLSFTTGLLEGSSDPGKISLFFILLYISIAFTFAAVLSPWKIPGFRSFFAPFLIVATNATLAFEYVSLTSDLPFFVALPIASYHLFVVGYLVVTFRTSDKITHAIDREYKTQLWHVAWCVAVVLVVFVYFYVLQADYISWTIPISVSILLWQLCETRLKNENK